MEERIANMLVCPVCKSKLDIEVEKIEEGAVEDWFKDAELTNIEKLRIPTSLRGKARC